MQSVSNICHGFCRFKYNELVVTTGVAYSIDDMYNSLMQDCKRVVHMSSMDSYYLAVTAAFVIKDISVKISAAYDCYVG